MSVEHYARKRDGYLIYLSVFRGPKGRRLKRKIVELPPDATKKAQARAWAETLQHSYDQRKQIEAGTWVGPRADTEGEQLTFGSLVRKFLKQYDCSSDYYHGQSKTWLRYIDNDKPADSSKIRRPSEPHIKKTYLSVEQEAQLIAASPPWLRRVIRWAIGSGMDRGEILVMKWSDIDQTAGSVHAPRSKTNIPRDIPLNESLLAMANHSATTIARLMGHSSTAITDTYMHLAPGHLRDAMATLDAPQQSRRDPVELEDVAVIQGLLSRTPTGMAGVPRRTLT